MITGVVVGAARYCSSCDFFCGCSIEGYISEACCGWDRPSETGTLATIRGITCLSSFFQGSFYVVGKNFNITLSKCSKNFAAFNMLFS